MGKKEFLKSCHVKSAIHVGDVNKVCRVRLYKKGFRVIRRLPK